MAPKKSPPDRKTRATSIQCRSTRLREAYVTATLPSGETALFVPVHMPENPADAIEEGLFHLIAGRVPDGAAIYNHFSACMTHDAVMNYVRTLLSTMIEADELLYRAGIIKQKPPRLPARGNLEDLQQWAYRTWQPDMAHKPVSSARTPPWE